MGIYGLFFFVENILLNMKLLVLCLSLVFGFFTTANAQCGAEININDNRVNSTVLEKIWSQYKKDNQKTFADIGDEYIRKHVFADYYNKQNSKLRLRGFKEEVQAALHQFSDMTDTEFINRPGCLKVDESILASDSNGTDIQLRAEELGQDYRYDPNEKLPDQFDWTDKGMVTRIKNQAHCQACWAFSAVGAMEGQYAMKTKHLATFSEQQMIDCVTNRGCHGESSPLKAYIFAIKKGIVAEDLYPYTDKDQKCHMDNVPYMVEFTDFILIDQKNENAMKSALYHLGPLSVAISVSVAFKYYHDGVITDYCGKEDIYHLTHGVVVVGYGVDENGIKYWKCKNSWGANWGSLGGYFLLQRDVNKCGISLLASVPIL